MGKDQINRIIKEFGGPTKIARKFGITQSAVSQWRNNGIPKYWILFMRKSRPGFFRLLDDEK